MLRASSLGLNILSSSLFTIHSCQRVCRFGTRWVTIRTSYNTTRKTTAQFHPLEHIPSIDIEGEDFPLRGKQVHTQSGSPTTHPIPVSSMTVKENPSNPLTISPPMSATETADEIHFSEAESPRSIPSAGNVLDGVYGTLKAPKSSPVSQSRSYAAGRPWSTESVQKVNLPKYILSPLRRIRMETVRAHRLYFQAQNVGKIAPSKKGKKGEKKNSSSQVDKKTDNASKVTPSMKDPPFPEYKEEQNSGKNAPSMRESPFQNYDQAQNSNDSMKKSPLTDYRQAQSASDSLKEPLLQDYNQANEVTPPMKKPPLRDPASLLIRHFEVIATTNSVDEGWNSYVFLVDLISGAPLIQKHLQYIPFAHLHRMARLLARNRPQTRRQFLRLLAVLTYLNYWGGKLKQHEWNALIAHAGSGWRKTKLEDFGNAMKVFNDMRAGRLPGSSSLLPPDREFLEGPVVQPDIYTYTSLLAIASRAMDSKNVYNISSMLSTAGLPPNRITHLSLMRYFTLKSDLSGIRATLLKMRQQGLELGLDGLNACLWAYGRNARVDIVMMIYRTLRHNALPETHTGEMDINDIIGRLGEEYIFVERELHPNEVTLTTVIQIMAYHGHFTSTLNVFMDMLSFNNLEKGAPLEETSAGVYERTSYQPSLAVFRAIFLGFSRHAKHIQHDSGWTLDNLSQLFDLFLELPPDSNLTHNTIYLIILAFAKASGRDIKILRDVWMSVDRKFGIQFHKAHSVSRLARLRRLLFPEEEVIR